jgi:DtxR family Mn-dependent transcriptional regulator
VQGKNVVSLTVENYLKEILLLEPSHGREPVSTGRIAAALGVAPGTVTAMLKTLEQAGLVRYRRYGGVQLTREGESLALHVQRRHRVVELFLVKVLGMPWTDVHEDAEALEHAVSDKVLKRMDAILGHPTADPHGDPIPQADGQLPSGPQDALSSARAGQRLTVVRLLDQRPEFLKLAERLGLEPGAAVAVERRDEPGQVLHLLAGARRVAVGIAAAENIMVRVAARGDAGGGRASVRHAPGPRARRSPEPARRGGRRGRR